MKNNEERLIRILGWIAVGIAFLLTGIITFRGTWAFFHSDDATVILFGREQWQQKRLFPDGWNYGTDIWSIGLNTLILPFFKLCRHWLDARACAVVVQTLLMVALMYGWRRLAIIQRHWWLCVLLMLLPVSEVVTEHWYFQATYMSAILWLSLLLLFTFLSMDEKRGRRWSGLLCLFLVLVSRVSMGFMMLLVFAAPMLGSLIGYGVYEYRRKECDKGFVRRLAAVAADLSAASLVGILLNNYILSRVHMPSGATGGYAFTPFQNIGVSLENLVNCLCRLYGAADTGGVSLLSLSGIVKALCFVFLCFMLIYLPVSIVRNRSRIICRRKQLLLIFMLISSMATIYIFVFTGMPHARYLIWIYFYSILCLGIWMTDIAEFSWFRIRELRWGLGLFLAALSLSVYTYYMTYDYDTNPERLGVNNQDLNYKVDEELIGYLEKKNYTYGYGGYWESYSTMAYTDGKIRMAALEKDWKTPYYWLNSEKWYKEETHKGRCFLLVSAYQYENELPEVYKKHAEQTKSFRNNRILIFKNMHVLRKIWDSYEEEKQELAE